MSIWEGRSKGCGAGGHCRPLQRMLRSKHGSPHTGFCTHNTHFYSTEKLRFSRMHQGNGAHHAGAEEAAKDSVHGICAQDLGTDQHGHRKTVCTY